MFTILFSEKESRIGEYQVIATLVTVKLECKDPYQQFGPIIGKKFSNKGFDHKWKPSTNRKLIKQEKDYNCIEELAHQIKERLFSCRNI